MPTSMLDRNDRQADIKLTQKFGGVFEHMTASMYRVDSSGIITECQGEGLLRMGLTASEVIGRDVTSIFPEIAEDLNRALAGETVPGILHGKLDGQSWWFQNNLAYDNEEKSGAYGFAIDITDQRLAEQAATRVSAEQKMILDCAEIGILFMKDGLVKRTNAYFNKNFGLRKNEAFGRDTRDLFPTYEDYIDAWSEALPMFTSGLAYRKESIMKRSDGTLFWCRGLARAVDPEHVEIGQIWLVEDISERKKADDELARLIAEQDMILDNAEFAIFMSNDRKILRANRHYYKIFGRDPVAANTRNVDQLEAYKVLGFPDQDSYHQFGREAYPVLGKGDIYQTERQMMRENGELFWCRILGKKLPLINTSKSFLWIIVDIDKRKKAELEILELNEQLEERVA